MNLVFSFDETNFFFLKDLSTSVVEGKYAVALAIFDAVKIVLDAVGAVFDAVGAVLDAFEAVEPQGKIRLIMSYAKKSPFHQKETMLIKIRIKMTIKPI